MKLKLFLLLSLLFITIALTNCSKEIRIETENSKELSSDSYNNQENQEIKADNPIKTIVPDSLSIYLPKAIPGTTLSPLKSGFMEEGNVTITSISREYAFDKGGFLKFSITDYGDESNIPEFEVRLMKKPPEESGKVTQIIQVPHGSGYSLWDEVKRTGSFYGMVNKRFILRIDGYNLPDSFNGFQSYISYFKLDDLVEYSKNN